MVRMSNQICARGGALLVLVSAHDSTRKPKQQKARIGGGVTPCQSFFDHPNPAGLSSRVRGSVEMKWWIREAVKIDEYI